MSKDALVPIRECEVCHEVGVMWTVPLNKEDSIVLCTQDKELIEFLQENADYLFGRKGAE